MIFWGSKIEILKSLEPQPKIALLFKEYIRHNFKKTLRKVDCRPPDEPTKYGLEAQ